VRRWYSSRYPSSVVALQAGATRKLTPRVCVLWAAGDGMARLSSDLQAWEQMSGGGQQTDGKPSPSVRGPGLCARQHVFLDKGSDGDDARLAARYGYARLPWRPREREGRGRGKGYLRRSVALHPDWQGQRDMRQILAETRRDR
jgi:hypothetical protein